MSSWTALNIAYEGDWEMPELFLYKITAKRHPNDGFDLLLYAYEGGDRGERALSMMRELAHDHGTPVELVSVAGSDTSGRFTLKQWKDGETVESWGSPSVREDDGFDVQPSHGSTRDKIEEEIGRRPDFGGNYAGH